MPIPPDSCDLCIMNKNEGKEVITLASDPPQVLCTCLVCWLVAPYAVGLIAVSDDENATDILKDID